MAMSSNRNSNLIDVNQNNDLVTSSYRLTGDQQAAEWQEQVKAYRRELEKNEEPVGNQRSLSPRSETNSVDTSTGSTSTLCSSTRFARPKKFYHLDSPGAELAAARIKIENLSAENRELISKIDLKDNFLQETRSKILLFKENDARQGVVIKALQDEVNHLRQKSDALEKITNKGTITIETLQNEHRVALEKIDQLETRLKSCSSSKEELEVDRESYKQKYFDVLTRVGESLDVDTEEGKKADVVDVFVSTGKNLKQEQLLLQSRVQFLEDALAAHNLETRASRETIMRLVSEVGKEQKNSAEAADEAEKIKQECQGFAAEKESLLREIELLKKSLEANDKTWASSRDELTQTASKASLLAEELKRVEVEKNSVKNEYKFFLDSLAQVLSNPCTDVTPTEESIRKRVKDLVVSEQERKNRVDELEAKVLEVSSGFERQVDVNETSKCLVKKAVGAVCQNNEQMKDLENELATGEVIRDTLRREKLKYLSFLQELAEAMKMEEVACDLGYDFNTDVLIARAHQLAKLECDALVEKTSSNYNLQRKLKAMKEEGKNMEMSMELLRNKIKTLEEKDRTRNGLALDRDDAIVTAQRLHRKVERLQHALGDERVKVARLKVELENLQQLKIITREQQKKIDQLVNSLGKVSSTKDRQRQRLSSLKRNLSVTELDLEQRNERAEARVQALSDDLRRTKCALDDVTRREKQLVDFRDMIARILGMNVSNLSIPDYEVISRLEKLIRQQQIGIAAAIPAENSNASRLPYPGKVENSRSPSTSPYYSPTPPGLMKDADVVQGPKRSYRRSRSTSPKRY